MIAKLKYDNYYDGRRVMRAIADMDLKIIKIIHRPLWLKPIVMIEVANQRELNHLLYKCNDYASYTVELVEVIE